MINPETEYPGQIDTATAAYPYGKARNDTTPDDGLGTPLEAKWMNDVFGFQAALMDAAGLTPSGTTEQVGASQLLTALNTVVSAAILAERQARYPVGEVFITLQNSDPATILGFGTWTRVATGRALVGYDAGDTDFNAAEKLSGSKTHTLTVGEMPAHTHTVTRKAGDGGFDLGTGDAAGTSADIATSSTGGGGAHNNVQPSYVVFVWKRAT